MNAPSEYLRLPFFSCMFVLQSREAVDALYQMNEGTVPTYIDPLTVFLTESDFHGRRKISIVVSHSGDERNHCLIKRELLLDPRWSLEQSLKTDWTNLFKSHPSWGPADQDEYIYPPDEDDLFYEDGLRFFRIIVNAILYLASSDPDISLRRSPVAALARLPRPSLNRQQKRELLRISSLDAMAVGAHVRPIVVGAPAAQGHAVGTSAFQIGHRFIVRGHWRNQAHGEEMTLRRLIWIEPFWKGPEMAEVVARPYRVI